MTRSEAYETLTGLITNPNLIKHHLACEAIMIALCRRLVPNADEITLNKWGTVGLLHDADYEQTKDTPEKHTLVFEQELGDKLDGDVVYAIKSHNFLHNGIAPQSLMDWSIYACDELSGLIIAAALVHPDKRLISLDVDFILNRFNDSSFAKGADRDQIKTCEEKLGIPLKEFIQIALTSMQGISSELNL
jgi:predicted hydrolase (HD superfamily)